MRSHRLGAALLLAGGVVATAGGAAADVTPAAPVGRTAPVKVTATDTRPTRAYEPPTLLIHPTDADTIVGATIELTSGECRLLRSHDGGRGWELLERTPSPPEFPPVLQGGGVRLPQRDAPRLGAQRHPVLGPQRPAPHPRRP